MAGVGDALLEVLSHSPAGLSLDFDGTLSPIAARPEEATLAPRARETLRVLARELAVTAIISGRPARSLAQLVALPELVYLGNHGLERISGNQASSVTPAMSAMYALATIRDGAQDALDMEPGILIEDKGLSFAVHFRLAPDPAKARLAVLETLQRLLEPGVEILEGRRVVEVRTAANTNKGTALDALAQDHGLNSLAYVGDDLTDTAAFAALVNLRSQRGLHTLRIAVRNPEAPAVADLADCSLDSVDEVLELLTRLAGALTDRACGLR